MDPTRTVASKIKTTIGQFRTPQPIRRTKSKLPMRELFDFRLVEILYKFNPIAQTEKATRKAKPLAPVNEENVEQKLLLGITLHLKYLYLF